MSTLYHSEQLPTTGGIYRITCAMNRKIYVGSAVNLRRRWQEHQSRLERGTHPNPNMQRAWKKYGSGTFTFEVLEYVLLPEMLTAREQHYFTKLNPFGKRGFNINPTADSRLGAKQPPDAIEKVRAANLGNTYRLGSTASKETREKLRQAHLGRKHSKEAKRKIADARIGKTYGPETRERIRQVTLGHPVSDATRAKLRAANLGKQSHKPKAPNPKVSKPKAPKERKPRKSIPRTPEWGANISRAKMGHTVSPESRERMRLAHLGKNLGHDVSPETRLKIRESKADHMQTLIVTSPDGEEFMVTGIRHFCIQHDLHQSAIMRVAKGKQIQHKGWKARFPDS